MNRCERAASLGCTPSGHIRTSRGIVRCPCKEVDLRSRFLGKFAVDELPDESLLVGSLDVNMVTEDPVELLRPHIAKALLYNRSLGRTYVDLDAYRLIDIFLSQDEEHSTQFSVLSYDIAILFLGFGDPRNRYLPELLVQFINRRLLDRKPVWFLLGCSYEDIPVRYSATLLRSLEENYSRTTLVGSA